MASIALDKRRFGLGVMFDIVWKRRNNDKTMRGLRMLATYWKYSPWLKEHVKNYSDKYYTDENLNVILKEDLVIYSRPFDDPFDVLANVMIHRVEGDFGIICRKSEHNVVNDWSAFPDKIIGSNILAHNLYGIKDFSGKVPEISNSVGTVNFSFLLPALESFSGLDDWIKGLDSFTLEIECTNPGLDIDSVTGFLDTLLKNYKGKCKRLVLVLNPAFEKRMQDYIGQKLLLNSVSSGIEWVDVLFES